MFTVAGSIPRAATRRSSVALTPVARAARPTTGGGSVLVEQKTALRSNPKILEGISSTTRTMLPEGIAKTIAETTRADSGFLVHMARMRKHMTVLNAISAGNIVFILSTLHLFISQKQSYKDALKLLSYN